MLLLVLASLSSLFFFSVLLFLCFYLSLPLFFRSSQCWPNQQCLTFSLSNYAWVASLTLLIFNQPLPKTDADNLIHFFVHFFFLTLICGVIIQEQITLVCFLNRWEMGLRLLSLGRKMHSNSILLILIILNAFNVRKNYRFRRTREQR